MIHFFSKIQLALLCCCVLVGCDSSRPTQIVEIENEMRAPSMSAAFATFSNLCYKTAPNFETFDVEAQALGFEPSSSGWLRHSLAEMSIILREGPSGFSCQFTFTAEEGKSAFVDLMETPFNARETTKDELEETFQLQTFLPRPGPRLFPDDRYFVSATNFDGINAAFLARIFDSSLSTPNNDRYGLLLLVAR